MTLFPLNLSKLRHLFCYALSVVSEGRTPRLTAVPSDSEISMQATNDIALQTVPEVADWLRLTVPRVYELVREGALPAVRIGRQIRIDPAGVREYDLVTAALSEDVLPLFGALP